MLAGFLFGPGHAGSDARPLRERSKELLPGTSVPEPGSGSPGTQGKLHPRARATGSPERPSLAVGIGVTLTPSDSTSHGIPPEFFLRYPSIPSPSLHIALDLPTICPTIILASSIPAGYAKGWRAGNRLRRRAIPGLTPSPEGMLPDGHNTSVD